MKFIISFMVMLSIFPIVNILCRAYNLDSITSAMLYIVYLKNAIISTGIAFLTGTFLKVKHKKILQITIVFILGLGISFIDSFILKDISSMFVIISSIIISLIMLRLYYLSNDIFSNVYIFIGISSLKDNLSVPAKQLFDRIFNEKSENTIFIFADHYTSYRKLQLESWYQNNIDNTVIV